MFFHKLRCIRRCAYSCANNLIKAGNFCTSHLIGAPAEIISQVIKDRQQCLTNRCLRLGSERWRRLMGVGLFTLLSHKIPSAVFNQVAPTTKRRLLGSESWRRLMEQSNYLSYRIIKAHLQCLTKGVDDQAANVGIRRLDYSNRHHGYKCQFT